MAQVINLCDTMHAADRAERGTSLFDVVLTMQVLVGVPLERDAWMTALLRTPVHETVFADVQVAAAGAAVPIVRQAGRQVALETVVVDVIEDGRADLGHPLQHCALLVVERQEMAAAIVDDADRRHEPELARAPRNGERIARISGATADD